MSGGGSDGLALRHRFTGGTQDRHGLVLLGARTYDPELGRFLEPDSVVPSLGRPQSLHRYAYVESSPLHATDPTGHSLMPLPPGHPGNPFPGSTVTHHTLDVSATLTWQIGSGVDFLLSQSWIGAVDMDQFMGLLAQVLGGTDLRDMPNPFEGAGEGGAIPRLSLDGIPGSRGPIVKPEHPHDASASGIGDAVEGARGLLNDLAIQRAEATTLAEVERMRLDVMRSHGGEFPESDQWVWRVFRHRDAPATNQSSLLKAFVTRPLPVVPGTPRSEIPEPDLLFPGGRRFDWTEIRGPHQIYRADP